jgi:hypothetical protein
MHYIQVLSQHRLCKAGHAYLTYLMLQRQLSNLNGRRLDHRQSESKSELLCDWRFNSNQFISATSPLRLTTTNFILQLNTCSYSPYVTSSLTRGWVYRLQLLLVLVSADILGSESRGTRDHILLSQIRDFPNLGGQVPVFISPRNLVASNYEASARTAQ